ncbi:MAG TPA: BolA family protein [Methylovirgula sp.]|nr:BolA family protein [Methylovirgula sp.]
MNAPSSRAARIREKLHAALAPASLEVIDDSMKHVGHAHAPRPGKAGEPGETHFTIKVVSQVFEGKSRIERHRMINDLLSGEIGEGLHALSIDAKAPGE